MSVWDDGFKLQIERQMAENPMMSAVYSQALANLRAGYYDDRYTCALGQNFLVGCDIYEGAAFANLHAALATGQIVYTTINIGMKPTEDKRSKIMNQRLSRLEGMRFYSASKDGARREEPLRLRATFRGGNQSDHDGSFEWTGPLEFGVEGKQKITQLSGSLPLEVGYIPVARTLAILARLRGLARWPYGQDDIWLFQVVDNELWQPFARHEVKQVAFSREWNPADFEQQELFAA